MLKVPIVIVIGDVWCAEFRMAASAAHGLMTWAAGANQSRAAFQNTAVAAGGGVYFFNSGQADWLTGKKAWSAGIVEVKS